MTAARIVEALDELEHGHPRFGLGLEPVPIQGLALERGEETLALKLPMLHYAYVANRVDEDRPDWVPEYHDRSALRRS